jgi:hypothetical protein
MTDIYIEGLELWSGLQNIHECRKICVSQGNLVPSLQNLRTEL